MADDLVEAGVDKPVELDLGHRLEAAQRESDGHADDRGLGERRIEDTLLPEGFLQAIGDPEHPAERANILTEHQDVLITGQGITQGEVDRFGHRHGFHQLLSSDASNSSRSSRKLSGGRA